MVQSRKKAETPAERLARLASAARPASELTGDAGPLPPVGEGTDVSHVTSHVTDDVTLPDGASTPSNGHGGDVLDAQSEALHGSSQETPHTAGNVTSHVTGHVTEDDAYHVTHHEASDVTGGGSSHASSHETGHVAEDDTASDAVHTPGHVTSHTASHTASHGGGGLSIRVRGRWNNEQLTYINHLAKQQKARAGEIIRYVLAWYLTHQGDEFAAPRSLAPSADFLVKREVGLKVLDFLTTADQAAAIKRAAGDAGEAAWMRRAVDTFKARGPWARP